MFVESIKAVWQAMATGFQMDSGLDEVDRLVSSGGMASMLLTVWLIIGAVTFGALLEEFGMISPAGRSDDPRPPRPPGGSSHGVRVRLRPERRGR